jgi:signal peptidase I
MVAVLLALSNVVCGPGFVQGLSSRTRAMLIGHAAWLIAVIVALFTTWGLVLLGAVMIGSVADAYLGLRRRSRSTTQSEFVPATAPPRWNGLMGGMSVVGTVVAAIVVNLLAFRLYNIPSSNMEPTLTVGDRIYANTLRRTPGRGDVIVFAQPCTPERDYIKRVIAVGGDTIEIRCTRVYINGTAIEEQLVDEAATHQDRDESLGEWFTRDVSRYRESHGGHTYETFHDRERPARDRSRAQASDEPDRKDFPSVVLRHCGNLEYDMGGVAEAQPTGKIVETVAAPASPCELHRHFVVPEDTLFVMGDNRDNSNDSRFWGVVPVENVRGTLVGVWYPFGRFGGRD